MKKIMLGLFIAIGFSACDVNDGNDDYISCGMFENMEFTSYDLDSNYTIKTMPTTPGVLIVSTQEKLDSFFTVIPPNPAENSVPTGVDFTKNYLVGIFAGTKSTTGYQIKISSILENDCEIVVQYYEKEPAEDEDNEPGLNNPYDFVLIPKTDKPIYFNKVSEVKNFVVLGNNDNTQNLYSETDLNIMQYLYVIAPNYNIANYGFASLTKKGQYTEFVKTIPAEIIALSGQTKTYGAPDAANKTEIYFQLNKNGVRTTVFFDTANTADQSAEIIAFKNTLIARIDSYKTAPTM